MRSLRTVLQSTTRSETTQRDTFRGEAVLV
ncbi:hypothetical protein ID866_763 [Astraeus odoratus]|nr:hypothetical protein ID866_763 [Astraeus odoratus]